ncbi:hypothetical protein SAMN04515648_1023 [Phyllobacterium sp. CL33Tsu]|nr:hypothetical protein SAMN04515648_1023 [Phyllobacterium sp. CL33Tsu]
MENLLTGMHAIAAQRGDGLLPDLARVISMRSANYDGNAHPPVYGSTIDLQQTSDATIGSTSLRQAKGQSVV